MTVPLLRGLDDPSFPPACAADTDGLYDFLDTDDDNDGFRSTLEKLFGDANNDGIPDTGFDPDNDGLPDFMDANDDGDTVPTALEGGWIPTARERRVPAAPQSPDRADPPASQSSPFLVRSNCGVA